MEEFEKEEVEEKREEPKKQSEIRFSMQAVYICMALIAMFLLVLCRVLMNFGVGNMTIHGVISIFIYGIPLAGAILAYLSEKKFSPEFWLNVVAFGVAILGY